MRVKVRWIELLVIISVIGILAGLMIPAGEFDFRHRYPSSAPVCADHLAGIASEYYLGDGLGMNLRLSILADGRYSLISSGCTAVAHRESGHVRVANGRYILAHTGPDEPGIERTFLLIGWDHRRYLIPPGEVQEFRDAIIAGQEPREGLHGRFDVRLPIAPADGLPDSPPEFARALRQEGLLGKV
jgi:hypothetical protein